MVRVVRQTLHPSLSLFRFLSSHFPSPGLVYEVLCSCHINFLLFSSSIHLDQRSKFDCQRLALANRAARCFAHSGTDHLSERLAPKAQQVRS